MPCAWTTLETCTNGRLQQVARCDARKQKEVLVAGGGCESFVDGCPAPNELDSPEAPRRSTPRIRWNSEEHMFNQS